MFVMSNEVRDCLAKHIRNQCVSPQISRGFGNGHLGEILMLPVSYFLFDPEKGFGDPEKSSVLFS